MVERDQLRPESKPTFSRIALVPVHAGEGARVFLLGLLAFFLGLATLLTQTAAFALFLADYGARTLPYAYLITALLAALVAFGYLRVAERLPLPKLLLLNLNLLLAGSSVLWLALSRLSAHWLIFALPLWFLVLSNLSGLAFWALAGALFDIRQAKRLFGLINAGTWVASIIGGLAVTPLVRQFGALNLLVPASLSLAAALIVLWIAIRKHLGAHILPAAQSASEDGPGLWRRSYAQLIIAFVFIWWLGYYFIDIIFYERAAAYYVNANQLADFLGGFFSLSGLIALITTTFFTAPLLDRYGLWVGLLIVPCIIVAAIAGLILAGMFGAAAGVLFGFAVLAKLVNLALGFALDLPAHAILYNPFSASQVGRLSTIAEGIVQPLAIGVAGVALLAVNAGWALGELAQPVMFLAIGAIWIAVVILLIRAYPRVLALAFARRQLSTSAQALPDHASLAVLQRELHNPYAGAALYALQLLEQLAPQALESTVPELLNHPASEVRAAAIAAIERLELHEAGAALRAHLLEEQEPTVRGATLQALAAVDPSTLELVVATLHEADPEVLRGALVGLIRHGGIDGVMAAGQRFNALTNSETATERALAARVLGDVGVKHFYQPLWALLADTEPSVQRAALAAAGKIAHPRLWPAVVAASVAPETSRAASSALIVGGEQTLDAIAAGLARPDLRSHGRIALARACGRIGGQRAVALLAEMVNYPDPGVRTQVLAALCACPIPVNPEPLQAQLHTELAEAAWLTAMLVEASSNPRLTLLANALATALQRSRDRIFVLLALLFDRPAILQARDAIASTVAAQRAHAIEVIDVQIPPPLRRFVLPLIEDRPPADRLTQLRPIYGLPDSGALDLPSMLTGSRSTTIAPWVRACAIDAVVQLQTANAYPALTALVNTPNHLIAETATWALAQINQIHLQADTVSTRPNKGAETMLSTIEKVIILKTVSVFSQTPDDVLAVVAGLLEEVDVRADQQVFAKGDYGDCLYIIIRGRVRVHDGDRLLDELGERDVFGEMALLDPQPRLASVTASEAVHLFRLAEAPFYELISEQPEVAIGIIRVLTRRLRERVQDLATLNQRVNDLEATQIAPETPVLYRQHTAGEVAASV